jgi:hypothetical protein
VAAVASERWPLAAGLLTEATILDPFEGNRMRVQNYLNGGAAQVFNYHGTGLDAR